MMVRVNKATWIPATDVKKIRISFRYLRDIPHFVVIIDTTDDGYSTSFDNEDDAVA